MSSSFRSSGAAKRRAFCPWGERNPLNSGSKSRSCWAGGPMNRGHATRRAEVRKSGGWDGRDHRFARRGASAFRSRWCLPTKPVRSWSSENSALEWSFLARPCTDVESACEGMRTLPAFCSIAPCEGRIGAQIIVMRVQAFREANWPRHPRNEAGGAICRMAADSKHPCCDINRATSDARSSFYGKHNAEA